MTLPDSMKTVIGTPIIVADSTAYSPAAANALGTRTDQINCSGLVQATARQSNKLDFTANIDVDYVLGAVVELATAPTAGETVDFYMGWSSSVTAGVADPAGLAGVDGAYTGYSSNLTDSLKQLDFLGSMVLTSGTYAQIDLAISSFAPRNRYGTLVVYNNTASVAFGDAVETAFSITPLEMQTQE